MISEDISIPLCVDLDGTLIKEDTTQIAALKYCGYNPLKWLQIGLWFLYKRHAYMKQKLAQYITLTPDDWTIIPAMLQVIKEETEAGRKVFLVSATDMKFARAAANDPLCQKYFSDETVIASEGTVNLRSAEKANCLVEKFGEGKFIYAGNSTHDLPVWAKGTSSIIVVEDESSKLAKHLMNSQKNVTLLLQE
jgi:hypothetical protein